MSRKMVKCVSIIAAVVLMISMLAACGKSTESGSEKAGGQTTGQISNNTEKPVQQELYKIQALFPGDTPIDLDLVLAEVENRLKDSLNVKLDFSFISWSDYGNKVQVKLAAGEDFDLHLNAPWLNMIQMISNKAIQDWEPLMEKCGQTIIASFPQEMIEANRFDEKIMGIPLGNTLGYVSGMFIRQDLREKYGLKKPGTFEEFKQYLIKVKENENGMVPLSWSGSQYCLGTNVAYSLKHSIIQFGGNLCEVPILSKADGVEDIVPIYENTFVLEWIDMARKWYLEGLIDKDIFTMKDEKGAFSSGRIAACKGDCSLIAPVQDTLGGNLPGAKVEFIQFEGESFKQISEFKMMNFLCLNSKSKDSERVTKFINWIYEDQANYDLLQYGIKDKHWADTGNHTYDIPEGVDTSKNYIFPGYVLLWNPIFDRTQNNAPDDEKYWKNFLKDPNNFIVSPLVGFTPNTDPVKNEVAKVSAIWPQTMLPLLNGVVDISELPKIKKKMEDAGYLNVVDEAKKQVSDFIASKK